MLDQANDIGYKEVFAIMQIVDSSRDRRRQKQVLYLVRWKGYTDRENQISEPYEYAGDGEARCFTRFSSNESYRQEASKAGSEAGSEIEDEREEGDE